jgi:hypothetical protein
VPSPPSRSLPPPTLADVESWMERLYVAAAGATLRREDRRKAVEVVALLGEIRRAARGGRGELVLVDAAAGKAYVGLLAAKLVLEPAGRPARVITLERDARRTELASAAAASLGGGVAIECRACDVSDPAAWPAHPDVVVALHACGPASDAVLDRAIAAEARNILLVPCCTGEAVAAAPLAAAHAERGGIPRHAPVRRRFLQAVVDAERTLRLEAAGYETEVVELVAPTVTPENLLWRARRVREPVRMSQARETLARLRGAP